MIAMKHTPLQQDGSEQPQPKANAGNNHVVNLCESMELPLEKAQVHIDSANTEANTGYEPYSHWYLASQFWCPFCNQYLGGYNARLQFWRCECSTWYETKDKGWERNKHIELTDLQPSDSEATTRSANAPTPVTLKKRNEA